MSLQRREESGSDESSEESGSDESSEESGSDKSSEESGSDESSEESGSDESSEKTVSDEINTAVITAEDVHDHETNEVTIDDDIPPIRYRNWAHKGAKMRYKPTKKELIKGFLSNAFSKVTTHFSKKLQKLNNIVKRKKEKVRRIFNRN